ncbi:MAG: response regulator transcription factor [Thermoproteota archaeon]
MNNFLLKRVIVVDDDEDSRDTLSDILEFKGIEVVAKAIDGYDAVQKFSKYMPNVVLMDMMMPQYDGFYGLEHIKNIDPDAKIIIITADQTDETRTKLKKTQHALILLKPIDIEKLVKMINE